MSDESAADDEGLYRFWRFVEALRRRREDPGDLDDPAVVRALIERLEAEQAP